MALTFTYQEYSADGTGSNKTDVTAGIVYGSTSSATATAQSRPITAGDFSFNKNHRMQFTAGAGETYTVYIDSIARTDAVDLTATPYFATIIRGAIDDSFTALAATELSSTSGDASWLAADAAVTAGEFADTSTAWSTGLTTGSGGTIYSDYIKTQINTNEGGTSTAGSTGIVYTVTYTVAS